MTRRPTLGAHAWLAALLVTGLGAAGCVNGGMVGTPDDDPSAGRDVATDQEFTMAVGDMVRVEGTHVLVFFDAVTEDSRCPTGVNCPWEGDAAVRLELSADNAEFAPQPRTLHTALEPRSTEILGVTIRLVGVAPYPDANGPRIDPSSYVVTLVASRP